MTILLVLSVLQAGGLKVNPVKADTDTEPPVITIYSPVDGSTVNTPTITFTGKVTDNVGVTMVEIYVTDYHGTRLAGGFLPNSDGTFKLRIILSLGTNIFTFTAFDAAGNKAEKTITITLSFDFEAPVITIYSPADGSIVNTPTATVIGKVTDNAGVVSLVVNAVTIDFAPDGSFSQKVELVEGTNTIKLFAFDAVGNKGEKDLTVTYKKIFTTLTMQIGSNKMYIDNYTIDLYVSPEVSNGFIYIPITAISKGFGGVVEWIPDSKSIIVSLGDISIGLQIGSDTAVLNGNTLSIYPVYLKKGIPMIPLKVFSDGLNAKIEWDPSTQVITMSSSKVSFNPNLKSITVLYPENGSINPSGIIDIGPSKSITFDIIPNQLSKIKDVKVDGVSVGVVSAYTFENVTKDHTIEAIFEPITFTITSSAGSGGSISPSGAVTVNSGDLKTFTITPNNGYKISDVKVDGISIGAVSTYTFTNVTDNHTIEAVFEKSETVIVLQIGQTSFTVGGVPNTLDSPPIIKNNRTLLPIRAVVEALGGTVSWDGTAQKVTVLLGSNTIELWIGKSTARVNGNSIPIDAANNKVVPEIINDRTMLPLRFVTENLGCDVRWDGTTKTITITYGG